MRPRVRIIRPTEIGSGLPDTECGGLLVLAGTVPAEERFLGNGGQQWVSLNTESCPKEAAGVCFTTDGAANEYASKEAAFESAVAAASLALREGHEIHVSVPGRDAGNMTALGAE